jgi:hypothetical protein
VSLAGARRARSWGAARSQAAAIALKRDLSDGAAWSAAKAKEAARASIVSGRAGYSWAALRMRHAANETFRAKPPVIDQTRRALVVRRSTALICFDPKRAGLPAHRTG